MAETVRAPWVLELLDRVHRVATQPSTSEQRIAADVVAAIADSLGASPNLNAAMDRATVLLNRAELHKGGTVLLDVDDVRELLRAAHAEMLRQHHAKKAKP